MKINQYKKIGEDTYQFPHWSKKGKTYNEAVLKVMEELKASRPCYDWRSGNWTEKYLKETPRKVEAMKKLIKKGVVTVEVQLGQKYKGKSVKQARGLFESNEFGLGTYEVMCILLAEPSILKSYDDLFIDCPGDEYSWVADGDFSRSPIFFFDVRLWFGALDVSGASDLYGSASGFLPQSLETGTIETFESLTLPETLIINGIKYKRDE